MLVFQNLRFFQIFSPKSLVLVCPFIRSHTGYIAFEGRRQVVNDRSRLFQQIKQINLKPTSKIVFTFDPFRKDAKSIRDTMFCFSGEKVRNTNVKCLIKTEIIEDRSTEPSMIVSMTSESDKTLIFKTSNLSVLEIIREFNKLVLPLVKEEEIKIVETKSSKQFKSNRKR